ncbi:hypothetical protein DVH05_015190 [Phytophthora capsici]|nr:hypothetical protein DVH05_015190 [Phytophthora capsici]
MLGIKPFVQESVQSLPPAQLRLLAETLRIDLRGCEDRGDIERVLTGLVCLDQDTSLGVFLAWLRSTSQQKNGILASKKPQFNHTFLPAIASANQIKPVKDHHLDDEIKQKLSELDILEMSFKKAERLVHTGSPSFDKLKQFLLELTILRAKEQTTRAFLVRQVTVLKQHYEEMRAEMLHSRAQLAFFVDGFSNLRKRHDALLADATKMKAENETAQEIFISMSAHDCHFEHLMRSTLYKQLEENEEMRKKLQQSQEEVEKAAEKRKQLEKHISQLKNDRGDARKDAYCYKRQLRVCKKRMEKLQTSDGSFFRDQTVMLRQTVATLLGLLRDSVVRDTKSLKQSLSKEALRLLQQVLTPNVGEMEAESRHLRGNQEPESEEVEPIQPRVVHRQTLVDIDEVIKGVLLVEGATRTDAAECAQIMGEKLKYLPIDLKETLVLLQNRVEEERKKQQDLLELQQAQSEGQGTNSALQILNSTTEDRQPPTLETYGGALSKYVLEQMAAQGKRGFVLYNWPFSSRDVNLLSALGLSIDSVLNLEIVGTSTPAPIAPTPTPVTPAPASPKPKTPPPSSRGKSPAVTSATKGKTSPTKAPTASKSPAKSTTRTGSKPAPKPRASSPAKGPTPASKPKTPSPVSTSQLKTSEAPKVKKPPTAASALQGLGGILHSVGPAAFPIERVKAILQVLELQKRRKLAPVVRWDEDTRRTNELLAMWAEEVHMLVHIEQESRKPKKVEPPTPAASPKATTKRAASPSKGISRTPSKSKAASSTRSSPTKAATKARSVKK